MREERYILSIVAIIAVVAVICMLLLNQRTASNSPDENEVGFAAHQVYSAFEQPINTFSIDRTAVLFSSSDTQQTLTININDTAVYSTAYISINSGAWQQVTLTGTQLGGSWLTGQATGTIIIPKSNIPNETSTDNYIIIYSCMRNSSGWDCHDYKWQLMIFNTTKSSSNTTQNRSLSVIYAVNAGGPQYTSTVDGTIYGADNYYNGGNIASGPSISAPDGTLYESERWGAFSYNFPVDNGNYQVTLKFAEIYYSSTGQRRFNVAIEGQNVLSDFDMVQAAGGANKPVDRTFNVTVSDGGIDINFMTGSIDYPKISAIVVTGYAFSCTGSNNQTCTITNGQGIQYKTCDQTTGNWNAYGTCTVTSCNSGYTQNANSCIAAISCTGTNNQPCAITNGQGIQYRTCDTTTGNYSTYGTCTVQSCNNGYTQSGESCVNASNIQPITNPYGGKVYYVSSSMGTDSNNGTSINSPWKTITKVNSASLKAGDIVAFKRGDTFYGSIVPSNSGNATAPITLTSYGVGNKPIITGFTQVTAWTNLGNNIWESTNNISTLSTVNMVAIDDVNTAMGRYPNSDAANAGYFTYQSHTTTSFTSTDLAGEQNWAGAEAVVRVNHWELHRLPVSSVSNNKITISTTDTGYIVDGFGFFFQNDPRTLDQEGEWYYNPNTHKIRVYSTSQPTDVKVASVDFLINIDWLSYVTVKDMTFIGVNKHAINNGYISDHILIYNCSFKDIGESAIRIETLSNGIIDNNTITDTYSGGISIYYGSNNMFRNNYLENIGTDPGMHLSDTGYGAIEGGQIIENNIIKNAGHNGIVFGGSGASVKNNYINNYGTLLDDGGGIYTYTGAGGTALSNVKITGNIVLNGVGTIEGTPDTEPGNVNGIYLDDETMNVEVSRNTVSNVSRGGIFLHNARNISVYNNTVYNSAQQFLTQGDYSGAMNNNRIYDNKFIAQTQDQVGAALFTGGGDEAIVLGLFDNNVYARPIYDASIISTNNYARTLENWKAYSGQDQHSTRSPVDVPITVNINSLTGSNLYSNGNFTANVNGITCYNDIYSCSLSWNSNALDAGTLQAAMGSQVPGTNAEIVMSVGPITAGKKYLLRYTFKGSRDTSSTYEVYIRQNHAPGYWMTPTTYNRITSARVENAIILNPTSTETTADLKFVIPAEASAGLTVWLDNIRLYEADATYTDPAGYFRFEYNPTNTTKTITLDVPYVDVKNVTYTGSVTLQPFTSVVLIKK